MDVIDEKKLTELVVNPMLDRIEKEVIPQVKAQADAILASASNVINGTLVGLQAITDKAGADLAGIIAGLDGWTLTVEMPPIAIPPVTIRLNGPKGEKKVNGLLKGCGLVLALMAVMVLPMAAQTAAPVTTTAAAPLNYFVSVGGEYLRGVPNFAAGIVNFGVCGGQFCSISTLETGATTSTVRTGLGYQLVKSGSVSLIALADAGITASSTPSVALGNVGGGFLVRYNLGAAHPSLKNVGLTAGVRIAGVSGQSVQPEFMAAVSYWFGGGK